jgi:ribonuclease R
MRSKRDKKGGKESESRSDKGRSSRRGGDSTRNRKESAREAYARKEPTSPKGGPKSAKAIVLEVFSNSPDTVFTMRQVTRRLGVADQHGREQVQKLVKTLVQENKLLTVDEDKYMMNLKVEIVTGRVDLANSKYAYIVSAEREDDIRVHTEHLQYAMDGDLVKVEVLPSVRGGRQEGVVVEVLERSRTELVGLMELSKNFGFVVLWCPTSSAYTLMCL